MNMTYKKTAMWMLGMATLAVGAFGARSALAKPAATITAMPFAAAKWTNLMGDGGPSMSPLWGDPMKGGESGFLLKLPAGFVSPMHSHSHDYWAVTVAGKMSHWSDSQTEKDAVALPVGSYAMMPAKLKHISKCAPGAECIVFLRMKDKFDFTSVETKGDAKGDMKKDSKEAKKDMKDTKEAKK
jgi:quercetin dioxygenase-like cupin family protein